MKRIKRSVLLTAGAAAIAGNVYLIVKDDSKAVRTEWLDEWDRAKIADVVQSFSAEGVIVPSDEYPIYFDSSKGSLEEVLVKEGDAIQPGTDLFRYSPEDVDDEIARLTAEKKEAEQTISLIDNQLSQLRILLSQAEQEENLNLTAPSTDNDETTVIQSGDASTSLEQEILEKETEKQKLQEEVKKYDSLLAAQESKKDGLTVKSTHEGYVKSIDTTLSNPLIVINSSVPAVQGVFTEKQVAKAAVNQRVEVTVDTTLDQFDGTLGAVNTYPEEAPTVKQDSLYPFSAQLSGAETADLFPGLKANVKVVTAEQLDAVTVPHTAFLKRGDKLYVVVMDANGQLQRREVEAGLHADGTYQIASGVEDNELIVINPNELVVKSGSFITPVDLENIKKKPWATMTHTEKVKYALMGFLS